MDTRAIRQAAGIPLIRAAVAAGVSEPTARIYEANPDAVKDPGRRARLDAVYAQIRESGAKKSEVGDLLVHSRGVSSSDREVA